MTFDLERELRAALRKADPAEGFAERVNARIAREGVPGRVWTARPLRRAFAALAACTLIAALALHAWQARQEQQGLEARRQLIEALRVTGDKLDIAFRSVNDASRPLPAADDTGA
jgi:hypothetical protein